MTDQTVNSLVSVVEQLIDATPHEEIKFAL